MNGNNINTPSVNETKLIEQLLQNISVWWKYLLSKWKIILIFGLSGGVIGIGASLLTVPKYTAHLSFALVEKSAGGGLADLASSFGLGSLTGSNNGAFSGDNLLQIIQSRYAIEKTLLTPVEYKGKMKNLADIYIEFNKLDKKWAKNSKNAELRNLKFPIGQLRNTFSRTQDSVLFVFFEQITKPKILSVARKDKKVSIVNVDFTSKDELFSKLFVEVLMDQTYKFYKETKTSQSRANVDMMQHTADSVRMLYEGALFKSASISQVNINQALQFAAVPKIKQENNAQLYGAVYAEVLKNLETLKLDMARETPILQLIDTPRLPLKKTKIGIVKGIAFGGLFGGLLILFIFGVFIYLDEADLSKFKDPTNPNTKI